MSVQPSSPLQQAVMVLGGTSMWQVECSDLRGCDKISKKTPKKSPKGAAKVQQFFPRDASSTGDPSENKPNPRFHGFPVLMNPQTH